MAELTLRDGERLHFEDEGRGPALLLLHGFTGSARAWDADLVAALARGHRVLRPDLLGHGASSACEHPERYALDQVVGDLVELLDACEIERAIWIGYSMGGRIALGAAVLRADRCRALVLEGASPGLEQEDAREARRHADEILARRLESLPLRDFIDHWMALPLFSSQKRLGPERLLRERERRLANAPRALAACLRGLGSGAQPSLWARLPQLDLPALLLAGAEDTKFSEIAARIARVWPRSLERIVPEAGHATNLENPRAWLECVQPFLAQQGGSDEA